jgi:hypothetical protein
MVKLLLKKNKKNSLGQYPVYLRITINRKASFISTKHYIHANHWDAVEERVKESHPMHEQINLSVRSIKKKALDNLVDAGVKRKTLSSQILKDQTQHGHILTDIYLFKDSLVRSLKGKRSEATFENWDKHLRKLKEFHKSETLSFEDITVDFLNEFEIFLRNEGVNHRKNKDTGNYIYAIMKTIKSLFRKAKVHSPFGEYEMPAQTRGKKPHLSLLELDRWEKYAAEATDPELKQAAIYFLFGCYTGLRVSDWFLFDPQERVHSTYINAQAKKNGRWIAMPLYPRLSRVLKMVRKTPLKTSEPEINKSLKKITKDLKINKHISTHCARKTFAVTLCLDRGMSSETAATLMGITLSTFVQNYSRITPEKIKQEALQAWEGLEAAPVK